jgi:hypothetical protein
MESAAQDVDLLLGMRGGVTSTPSPIEVFSDNVFPPRYTSSSSSYSWGATVGTVLFDKFEVRVERARYLFHIDGRSGTPYPASLSKYTSATDGHIWQTPVLVAYRISSGFVRTFAGGGVTFRSIKGATTTERTTLNPFTGVETTTITTEPFQGARSDATAFNAGIGFELRKGWISLRPELRLGFWTGYQADEQNETVFSSPQAEFILGIRFHPFSIR